MNNEQHKNDLDQHSAEHHNEPVKIILDDKEVMAPRHRLNGKEIRELGPKDRVDGFETQLVNEQGKKIKTIPDDEQTELHNDERFRTVPNRGGPGGNS